MADKDTLGRDGEERAADYLGEHGYTIVSRNWRCRFGEIDIVAVRGVTAAIVEVKTRRGTAFGHPFEAVTAQKLRRLRLLAAEWGRGHPAAAGRRLRIDVIGIVHPPGGPVIVEHLCGVS